MEFWGLFTQFELFFFFFLVFFRNILFFFTLNLFILIGG